MRHISFCTLLIISLTTISQNLMTPEILWSLGRLSPENNTPDNSALIYGVTNYSIAENKGERNLFSISLKNFATTQITNTLGSESNVLKLPDGQMGYLYKGVLYSSNWDGTNAKQIISVPGGLNNIKISPDGKYILFTQDVKTKKTTSDIYQDLPKSNAKIIEDLHYRHWDSWEDEMNSHVFYAPFSQEGMSESLDIMQGEEFDSPQMPFGGSEDIIWSADSKKIYYVCKKKSGSYYFISTNTDIYSFDLETKKTENITEGMEGYDTYPIISPNGQKLAFLSMERDGYEADKNRLFVLDLANNTKVDYSETFDETIESIKWSNDNKKILFISPLKSSLQLFEIDLSEAQIMKGSNAGIKQITNGQFDINALLLETKDSYFVTMSDMNHASEIYSVSKIDGHLTQISQINKTVYENIKLSKVEQHWINTFDAQQMLVNVILPPNFDATKKYPVLLYCQGGPQSPLTQYYSFRWNFQLMAAQGYVVIAPCRRGMPGFGTQWNELISGDWGGRPIKDYISAIDWAKKLPYVDPQRCAAVGASYGGYAVYMLAGVHEGRFQSFIAHDGLFNLESFYGTTEEKWFAHWDMGGAYWEKGQRESYTIFNPISYAINWNTPIMIIQGGKDYRTTEDQAFQAFSLAQIKGIKSKFLYLPDENHWVLSCQNALVWQREFYKWLKETL